MFIYNTNPYLYYFMSHIPNYKNGEFENKEWEKFKETQKKVSDLSRQANSRFFRSESKENFLNSIESVKKVIDETFARLTPTENIETLEELNHRIALYEENVQLAEELVTSFDKFSDHCVFSTTPIGIKEEYHEWIEQVKNTRFAIGPEKINQLQTPLAIEQFKKRTLVPKDTQLAQLSKEHLYEIERELKELLVNQELSQIPHFEKIWWEDYNRLLPHLQKVRIECGEKGSLASTLELHKRGEATSMFALFLGSFDPADDLDGISSIKNSLLTLSFTIRSMNQMLINGEIPHNERKAFTDKLESYKSAYRIAFEQRRQLHGLSHPRTASEVLTAKKSCIDAIIKELETKNVVTISTGYKTEPFGHEIALTLKIETDSKGNRFVSGRIFNRGEGVEFHGDTYYQGTKTRINSQLELSSVPLEDLKKSPFFELLSELQASKLPLVGSELLGNDPSTYYKIQDFYGVVLPTWPGSITKVGGELLGLQIGGVCTAAYISSLKTDFSPSLSRYVKLKMRIEALELFFKNGTINQASIPLVRGMLKKIHRSIKKLETQKTLEGTLPLWLVNKLAIQKKYVQVLTKKVAKTLISIENSKGQSLLSNLVQHPSSAHEIDIFKLQDTGKITLPSIHVEKNPKKSPKKEFIPTPTVIPPPKDGFKKPEEVVKYLKIFSPHHDGFLYGKNKHLYEPTVKKVLEALPPASNRIFWSNPILRTPLVDADTGEALPSPIEKIHKLIMSLKNSVEYDFLDTGEQVYAKINAITGILISLKETNEFDPNYVQERAARLLELLTIALPQMRTERNKTNQHIIELIKELEKLADGKLLTPFFFERDRDYTGVILEKHVCTKIEDLQEDLVVGDAYNNLKGEKTIVKAMKELVLPNVFPGGQLHLLMNRLCYPIIVNIGLSGNKREAYISQRLDGYTDRYYENPTIHLTHIHGVKLNRSDSQDSRFGVMSDQLYRWEAAEHDRRIAQELLDPRLKWRNENRQTQNEQIKASRNSVKFAGTTLKSQEIERLLSISSHPDSMVSQVIHCFSEENSFHRLNNPCFCALLQGFLLTKDKSGKSILVDNFEKGGIRTVASLINFLQEGIKSAKESEWSETHLFLMFLLAQVIDHIPPAAKADSLIQSSLKLMRQEMVELVQKTLSPEKRNVCNHWLMAIYPFIEDLKGDDKEKIVEICKNIGKEFQKDYLPYQFRSPLIDSSFQRGHSVLVIDKENPKLSRTIPQWVFNHPGYFLSDREPKVTLLKEGEFELLTKQNIKYRLELLEDGEIKIFRDFELQKGKPESYLHVDRIDLNLTKKPLSNDIEYWIQERGDDILLIDKIDGSLKGKIVNGEIVHPQNSQLILASSEVESFRFIKHIAHLDEMDQTLIWKNKLTNKVEKIELPRLNLSFDKFENSWRCPEHKNKCIDFTSVIKELDPFSHFVILKDDKKERTVLLTNKKTASEKPTFSSQARSVKSVAIPKQFVLSVNKNGKLETPNEPEKLLYLIHLALGTNQYPRALQLIKKLDAVGKTWDEDTKNLLSLILSSRSEKEKDTSTYACYLRMRVRLSLLKSQATSTQIDLEEFASDYITYLNDKTLDGEWRLSRSEEIRVLRLLYKPNFCALEIRLKEIQRQQTLPLYQEVPQPKKLHKALQAVQPIGFDDASRSKWISKEVSQKMIQCLDNPAPITFLTRPGTAFIYNFLYYYKILYEKEPKAKVDEVMQLLSFCKYDSNPKIAALRRILINLNVGEKFLGKSFIIYPKPDELKKALERNTGVSLSQFFTHTSQWIHDPVLDPSPFIDKMSSDAQKTVHPAAPKKGVFKLKAPIPISFPKESAQSKSQEVLPLNRFTAALEKDELIQIRKTETDLIQERTLLEKMKKDLETKNRAKSRVTDGINERLAELNEILKGPCTSYVLPIIESAKNERGVIDPLSVKKLEMTQAFFSNQINDLNDKTEELGQKIEKLVNTRTEKTFGDVHAQIGRASHITLTDLLLSFGKGEDDKIPQMNTELTAEQLKEIKQLVIDYLTLKTDQQQLIRAEALLRSAISLGNEKGWSSPAAQQAADLFINTITQNRIFDPAKNLRLLVFESLSDIRLREDQFEALQKLSDPKGGDFELEARTGFGKTKVLVPLWLLLNNEPGRISTFTTTASLLEDQIVFLRKVLGDTYDKAFHEVNFTKENGNDIEYLAWLDLTMHEAQKTGGKIFLQKIDTLHSINGLALKDQIYKSKQSDSSQLLLLLSIRNKYKQGKHFIDESTECFDPRRTFDYAVGTPKTIDPAHCERAIEFYKNVILSPAILSKWNLEFLSPEHVAHITKSTDKVSNIPSEQNFDTEFLPDIIESTLLFLNIPTKDREMVAKILMGKDPDKAKEYLSKLTPKQKALFLYCSDQIRGLLKKTILKMCGVRYQAGQNGLAVPLSGGTPNPKSEFATVDDLINFTIQANLKNPLSQEVVKSYVSGIVKDIKTLGITRASKKPDVKNFLKLHKSLKLKSVVDFSDDDLNLITTAVNDPKGQDLKLEVINSSVLSKIRSYPRKLTGNSFTITDSLGVIHAASGTVQPNTLPPKIKTLEKRSAVVNNLLPIWKNSNHEILTIPTTNGIEFLTELLAKRPQDRVLTDIGGIMRGLSQKEIIDKIFEISSKRSWDPAIKGVVFYDDNRTRMIWERGASVPIRHEDSRLTIDEVFVYIRQSHAVGSDVPMSDTARGSNTVSRETQEKLLLQGLGRMRGLTTGQVANFVLTEEDAEVIRKELELEKGAKITLAHLFIYAQKLEVRQQQKDYYFALKQYMINCVERQLWEAFDSSVPTKKLSISDLSACFHKLINVLVESTDKNSEAALTAKTEEVSAEEAVRRIQDSVLNEVVKTSREDPILRTIFNEEGIKKVKDDFSKFVHLDRLPEKLTVGEENSEDVTVETETEKAQEVTREIELSQEKQLEVESEREEMLSAARNFDPAILTDWDGNYRSLMEKEAPEQVLGVGIFPSPNLLKIESSPKDERNVRKPAYQFLLKVDKDGKPNLMAFDLSDEKTARQFMKDNPAREGDREKYYILSNNRIISAEKSDESVDFEEVIRDPSIRAKIGIATRIYSGADSFSDQELKWVMDELKKQPLDQQRELQGLLKKTSAVWPNQQALLQAVTQNIEEAI